MPERPKRRKNNKNKRKNKNNKTDSGKSDSDVHSQASCSKQNENEDESVECEKVNIIVPETTLVNQQSSDANIVDSTEKLKLSEDLNNNNSHSQVKNEGLIADHIENVCNEIANYVVESPDQSLKTKSKLHNSVKSKSLDDDEATKIIEITEDSLPQPGDDTNSSLVESSNVIITDVDSDIEWENTNDFSTDTPVSQEVATGSMTTVALNIAQCGHAKTLSPDEEQSLRKYLKTLNLATQPELINSVEINTEIEQIINQEIKHRLRKKALAEDFFMSRIGPPRILDVIDEEGSSESSLASRRQSYLSEKKSDVEDLDDDVFEEKKTVVKRNSSSNKKIGQLIPQECVLVGAKLKEPEITEARGDWTVKTIEKLTGAELVYLTDTSSSTSSLHEIGEEDDAIETDTLVRMITPTIEVTDTENFLKKTFISNNNSIDTKEQPQIVENVKSEHVIPVEFEKEIKESQSENGSNLKQLTDGNSITSNPVQVSLDTTRSKQSVDSFLLNSLENSLAKTSNTNICPNLDDSTKISNKVDSTSLPENHQSDNTHTNMHEIVVLSTENIKTDLYVKDVDSVESKLSAGNSPTFKTGNFDLETKLIKCEFNDAINNLIKEVSSDSETTNEDKMESFTRQDSSSSVSSQCTAKYNPNYSSLNDVSNFMHDDASECNKTLTKNLVASHVKEVVHCVNESDPKVKDEINKEFNHSLTLKDLCVKKIASFPYGEKILEELASVSERLQNIALISEKRQPVNKFTDNSSNISQFSPTEVSNTKKLSNNGIPPPVQPRNSSLKKKQDDDQRTAVSASTGPFQICLSPSQKMLMEKTNTVITNENVSSLSEMRKKIMNRQENIESYQTSTVENKTENSPVIPFKSQTGSRLLALIRDPNLTRNINSLNQRLNTSSDNIQEKNVTTDSMSSKLNDGMNSIRHQTFKPIPPPRPKKFSSSYYESDESADFTDSSMRSIRSERKHFHYSTGNLNKEIEDDISSIQNMHRYRINTRDEGNSYEYPRRPSLPKDLCEQQMEYIRKKEKEVEAEIQRLEALNNCTYNLQRRGPRAPLMTEKDEVTKDFSSSYSFHKRDTKLKPPMQDYDKGNSNLGKMSVFSTSQEELLRDKMYTEYVTQMAERHERKQHKIIKITTPNQTSNKIVSKSMPTLDALEAKVNNRIEKEFISKAKERWDKLGIHDPETEDERDTNNSNVYKEPKVIEHKIKVVEGGEEKDVKKLPRHLQEFVRFTAKDTDQGVGNSGESQSGPASPHLVIMCAVIIIVLAIGKYFVRLLRNK